jgi:hypothetical protein
MEVDKLCVTHPTYNEGLWQRYDALYRGGEAFRACIEAFLPKNPDEPLPVYDARKTEAHYCGYIGPIVDFYAALLMSSALVVRAKDRKRLEAAGPDAPDLAADSFYARWKEDVDGVGTDLVDFLRARFTAACVKGRSWWLVERPDDAGQPPQTLAEWEARGLGEAFVVPLENEQVLDWEVDGRGELEWAVVHSFEQRRANVTQARSRVREVWRIYDRENIETFAIEYDPSAGEQRPKTASQVGPRKAHGFRRVPLVRLGFTGTRGVRFKHAGRVLKLSSSALEGFWVLQRLAEAQIAHFRCSAAMDWNIRRTCYAMPVFKLKAGDGGQPAPPRMGAGYYIMIGDGESADWIAPPTEHLSIVAKRISTLKDEIYRVANQMAQGVDNNAAAVGRSGKSKEVDASASEVLLGVYGALVREAAEQTYELLAEARGDGDIITWSVEGLDSFTLADPKALAEACAAAAQQVDSPTLRRELAYRLADALLPGMEQGTRDTIRREIDERLEAEDDAREARAARRPFGMTQGSTKDTDEMHAFRMDHRDDALRVRLPELLLGKIHVRPLGKVEAFTIWAVDGAALRLLDAAFSGGANPSRYAYVPASELWVEQRLAESPSDLACLVLNQALECAVMADGQIGHDAAHCAAAAFEELLRKMFAMGAAAADSPAAALAVAAQCVELWEDAARAHAEGRNPVLEEAPASRRPGTAEDPSPSSAGEKPGDPDPDSARPSPKGAAAKAPRAAGQATRRAVPAARSR